MKVYQSLQEIEDDLRIYNLERQIAEEEAKNMGFAIQRGIVPTSITKNLVRMASKYGLMLLLKRILR